MNMNLKSDAKSYIHYNGQDYPCMTITYEMDGNDYYDIVSVEALERELFDSEMIPKGVMERDIDNKIAFYVDNEDILNIPNKELIELIYS